LTFSRFFIDRPIFAGVLSMAILVAGLIAMTRLPVSEYPEVTPPSVVVNARFPGANPRVIADTVAGPLEEQVNGVEGMLYMSSLATTDGNLSLTVTFEIGTDPDLAQQKVQNRVSQALPRLPEVVRQLGVTVAKRSPDLTMVVHLRSPSKRYDELYLRNYGTLNVKDRLARLKGVGQAMVFGSGDYAMRIWLDPDRIAELDMTAQEVVTAIRQQNIEAAAGLIGAAPYDSGVLVQLPINAEGRLKTAEEFGEVVIKRSLDGTITRLRDVARIELAAQQYALRSLLDNVPAVAVAIFAAPGANALEISSSVRGAMAELAQGFPEGVDYKIVYDPTVFISESIDAVIRTLLEAIALVVLVVVIFLQTWRASVIPLLAVPVSIVGTLAIMLALGFSINVLTLFGLILAVGIVVDDAIVVVENVERGIEEGHHPRDAAIKAMGEVTGPIIATSLVIVAVFVPIAFISGLTGMFYRQFALTIAIATIISTFNSLTLSPALSAVLLRGRGAPKDALTRGMDFTLGWLFRLFNRVYGAGARGYTRGVGVFVGRKGIMLTAYAVLLGVTYWGFQLVPSGFIPAQDKQYLIGFAQLPQGATLERTESVIRRMSEIALKEPGVESAVAFPGLSINGFVNSTSSGIVFVTLDPFGQRSEPGLSGFAVAGHLQQKFAAIDQAFVAIFPPPPVLGLGTVGGFKLQVEDRGDAGYRALKRVMDQVLMKARAAPELAGVFSSYDINAPQLSVALDRTKANRLGVPVEEVFRTMQIYLGSIYVNDFNLFGRTYQVIAQADKRFRSAPDDIGRLQTRNIQGRMVPLGSVVTVKGGFGPETAMRYNTFRSADLTANPAPGYSSGQAQEKMVRILAETLPKGFDYEWTELTYQQILAGNTAVYVFPLCLLLVFLVLAAQYESVVLPLSILLIVPMSMLAAIFGVYLTGGDNNIFTQISMFVLAGLASKNAILIVEFARELERRGYDTVAAAIEASRLRLRPILMTSFAFIMGVVPLALAQGAGAEMRRAIGIAVFSGMLGVTFFGLILTPVFYVALRRLSTAKAAPAAAPAPETAPAASRAET